MNAPQAQETYTNRQCAHAILNLIATQPVNDTTFLDQLAQALRR